MLKRYKNRKKNLLPGFLIVVCFIISPMTHGRTAEPIAKFTQIEGRVDILRSGAMPAFFVKAGDAIFVRDVIRTKSNSKAEIFFKDGNILRLAQRSRVDISEYLTDASKSKEIITLQRGQVEADVDEGVVNRITISPEANQFEIHTPFAVAGVRGCKYSVYQRGNASVIFVKEGVVYVYNPKFPDKVVEVRAGQVTRVDEDTPPLRPRNATEEEMKRFEILGWMDDPLISLGDFMMRAFPAGPGISVSPPVTELYPDTVQPKAPVSPGPGPGPEPI